MMLALDRRLRRRSDSPRRSILVAACSFIFAAAALVLSSPAHAGGGPENVALIVNEDSSASLTVAKQYIRLRQIPDCNVFYLSGKGLDRGTVSIDEFRKKILIPVFNGISQRGLASQIDYVIYSAGFPTAIDVQADLKGAAAAASLPKYITKKASINGLTFLHKAVLAKDWRSYLSLQANSYAKAQGKGFRASYGWSPTGESVDPAVGRQYVLSTVLAVTSGRGNSIDEVSNYLRSAAGADATHPEGTIYLMENSNVRSTTREWAFERTVTALAKPGLNVRIETGTLPQQRRDVMGAVIGAANFDWKASGSRILPGAICEHLTSFGGDMRAGASQTPLSEFLRYGAAGSSGTVTEPYAIQAKFPTAFLHVSYANGCSLAESFYQSVSGPYQLLIVGDPLCQPWAHPPNVLAAGIESGETLSGQGVLKVAATAKQGVRHVELFLDGKRVGKYPREFSYPIDTRSLANGPHELRAVAVAKDALETQGRSIIPFQVSNGPVGDGE
jgi:uncharacterized protein (TIGR03790 family)